MAMAADGSAAAAASVLSRGLPPHQQKGDSLVGVVVNQQVVGLTKVLLDENLSLTPVHVGAFYLWRNVGLKAYVCPVDLSEMSTVHAPLSGSLIADN